MQVSATKQAGSSHNASDLYVRDTGIEFGFILHLNESLILGDHLFAMVSTRVLNLGSLWVQISFRKPVIRTQVSVLRHSR
jgi:hypothetical protein